MSKYIKPTISVLSANVASAATSSCSGSTADANEIKDLLLSMGYDLETAFAAHENCSSPVMFEEYCKFSSSIQVFLS